MGFDTIKKFIQKKRAKSKETDSFFTVARKFLIPDQIYFSKWKNAPLIIFGIFLICMIYMKLSSNMDESSDTSDTSDNKKENKKSSISSTSSTQIVHTFPNSQNDKIKHRYENNKTSLIVSVLRFFTTYFKFFSVSKSGTSLDTRQLEDDNDKTLERSDAIRVLFNAMKDECNSNSILINDMNIIFRPNHDSKSSPIHYSPKGNEINPQNYTSSAKDVFESLVRASSSVYISTFLFIHGRIAFSIIQSLFLVSANNTSLDTLNDKHDLKEKILDIFVQRFTTQHFPRLKLCLKTFFENNYELIESFNTNNCILYEDILSLIMHLKDMIDQNLDYIMTIDEEFFVTKSIIVNNSPIGKHIVQTQTHPLLSPNANPLTQAQINHQNNESISNITSPISHIKNLENSDQLIHDYSLLAFNSKYAPSPQAISEQQDDFNEYSEDTFYTNDSQSYSIILPNPNEYENYDFKHIYTQMSYTEESNSSINTIVEEHVKIYDNTTKREDFLTMIQECHKASIQCFLYRLLPEAIDNEQLMKQSLSFEEWISRLEKERSQSFGSPRLQYNQYLRNLDKQNLLSYFCCTV